MSFFKIVGDFVVFLFLGALVMHIFQPFDDDYPNPGSDSWAEYSLLGGFFVFVVGMTTLRAFQRRRIAREAMD
jgi:hypothetical protein